MTTYIALPVSKNQRPHPVFHLRGISGHTQGTASSIGMTGISKERELAYDGYRANIDVFIAATNRQERLSTTLLCAPFLKQRGFLPLKYPSVTFAVKTKLSSDQEDQLVNKMRGGSYKEKVGQRTKFIVTKPLPESAERYLGIHDPDFNTGGPNEVTPRGFKVLCFLNQAIFEFLATNTYPAFRGDSDENIMGDDFAEITFAYGKDGDGSHRIGVEAYKVRSTDFAAHRDSDAIDGMDAGNEGAPDYMRKVSQGYINAVREAVYFAKPSPIPASNNFGPLSKVPHLPGRLFPYIEGMLAPDFNYLKRVTIDLFFRNLGDSREAIMEGAKDFRRGIQSIANTPCGLIISHILIGVELALKTQTRLYLIFEDSYKGFILLGAKFSVFNGIEWHSEVGTEELRSQFTNIDSHSAAIQSICRIMSGLVLKSDGETKVGVEPKEIKSSMRLVKKLRERRITDVHSSAIDIELQKVYFGGDYNDVTVDSLVELVNAMFLTEDDPDDDEEVYIPTCKAPLDDHRFLHLATFGPEAPTVWNTRGSVVKIPREKETDKYYSKDNNGVEKLDLKCIVVGTKPVQVAYGDWLRAKKECSIQMDQNERAKDYRCYSYKSNTSKVILWNALKKGFSAKRARDDDMEVGPSSKRRRVAIEVSSADDILALF